MKRKIVGCLCLIGILFLAHHVMSNVLALVLGSVSEKLVWSMAGSAIAIITLSSLASDCLSGGTSLSSCLLSQWQVVTVKAVYRTEKELHVLIEVRPGEVLYVEFDRTKINDVVEGYHYRYTKGSLSALPIGKAASN